MVPCIDANVNMLVTKPIHKSKRARRKWMFVLGVIQMDIRHCFLYSSRQLMCVLQALATHQQILARGGMEQI